MFEDIRNTNFSEALKNNKQLRLITYGIGAVLVVVAGYFAYSFFIFKPANEKSKDSYYASLNYATADSTDLAIEEARRGVKKYDGKIGGELNQFILGRELMEKGEFKKALKELEGVKLDDTFLSVSVISLQGDCQSELKNFKAAKELYLKAAKKNVNDKTTPENLFKAALVAEKLNQKEEAFNLYTQIDNEYPNFASVKQIAKYISRTQK